MVYRDLIDTGEDVLLFRSGGGFVERHLIAKRGWSIEPLDDAPGWEIRQGWPAIFEGPPGSWELDGEPVDIRGFIADNREGMDPEDLLALWEIPPGGSAVFGGGAAPVFRLTRLR